MLIKKDNPLQVVCLKTHLHKKKDFLNAESELMEPGGVMRSL